MVPPPASWSSCSKLVAPDDVMEVGDTDPSRVEELRSSPATEVQIPYKHTSIKYSMIRDIYTLYITFHMLITRLSDKDGQINYCPCRSHGFRGPETCTITVNLGLSPMS